MNRMIIASLLVALCAAGPQSALASPQQIIFTLDDTVSDLSIVYDATSLGVGVLEPQTPGSDTTSVIGHFVVEFDPAIAAPPSIQFIGGHGFLEPQNTGSWLPGPNVQFDPNAAGTPVEAVFGLQTTDGLGFHAVRDLKWDWNSAAIPLSGGTYSGPATTFQVISTIGDTYFPQLPHVDTVDSAGFDDALTSGSWTLSESAPGSGDWTLTIPDAAYLDQFNILWSGSFVARAQFSAANVDTVDPNETTAEALGGSDEVGGVSASFNTAPVTGGEFTVQQVEFTGLSDQAIEAAEENPIFVVSTEDLLGDPQIWDVDFSGDLGGTSVTLTFAYDEVPILNAGIDELDLGIWHYNAFLAAWEFGGTVDPVANTIEFTTDNFSPFVLGTNAVPEPTTLMLALAGAVACFARRRRR